MSWHPSRASARPLDRAVPTRYRAATVQSRAGRSLLVQTADGDDRLLPGPTAPDPSLVGSTVLLANGYDWVVAVDAPDPIETVLVTTATNVVDLRDPPGPTAGPTAGPADLGDDLPRPERHLQRGRHRGHSRIAPFRRTTR